MAIEIPQIAKPPRTKAPRNKSWKIADLNVDLIGRSGLSDVEKERIYREFASLFDANIDVRNVIQILKELSEKKGTVKVLAGIQAKVEQGVTLSEAIAPMPEFTNYERSVIRIGEESSALPTVFAQLAEHYKGKLKLKRTVRQAMAYPLFVLCISSLVIIFMMNVVVPMFAEVFARSGAELPKLTRVVMHISESFKTWFGLLILGVIGAVIALKLAMKRATVSRRVEFFQLRIPFFGEIKRKTWLARISQSLDLLLRTGAPLDKAIELSADMNDSVVMRETLHTLKQDLVRGGSMKESLKKHVVFDTAFVAKVGVAEEIKQLDKTFSAMADQYTEEVEHKTAVMGSILEPATILIISVFVGIVLVAMYLPMFKLSTAF